MHLRCITGDGIGNEDISQHLRDVIEWAGMLFGSMKRDRVNRMDDDRLAARIAKTEKQTAGRLQNVDVESCTLLDKTQDMKKKLRSAIGRRSARQTTFRCLEMFIS